LRKVMDEGKILIVNLSKGRIGEDNSALLGAMLITKLQMAAMSRIDIPVDKRRDFYLYVDEFQNFSTESFANILSEARKYALNLTLAHQYIEQLDEKVRAAIFGNVGTVILFRVGAFDAEFLEKQFMPEFEVTDLVNLPNYHIYLKLLIDGVSGKPFSAAALPPISMIGESFSDVLIENSRRKYSVARSIVEDKIAYEWSAGVASAQDKVFRRDERPVREVLNSEEVIKHEAMRIKKDVIQKERPNVDIGDLQKSIRESLENKTEEKKSEN
ncbi:MAG: type IV secretory system conjugative DNA transfer family protein, partial [Patescibacteria group bacterium]